MCLCGLYSCIGIHVHVLQSRGGGSGVVAHMLICWDMELTFLNYL